MDCRAFSLEALLRLSVAYGLITTYRVSPRRVLLFRDEECLLAADPEETRHFLQGLLIGYGMTTRRQKGKPVKARKSARGRLEE